MTNFTNDSGTGVVVADGFALADGTPVGGNPLVVKSNGTVVATAATSINFTGNAVATSSGENVTVNISVPASSGVLPVLAPVTATVSPTNAPVMILSSFNPVIGNNDTQNVYIKAPSAILGNQFSVVVPTTSSFSLLIHPTGTDTIIGFTETNLQIQSISQFYCFTTGEWSIATIAYTP